MLLKYIGWSKVYKSEGRTLFFVYAQPSNKKLDRLVNKKYMFTITFCFLANPALQ